ncbi:leukocyte receptor cluster member 9 [Scomber japonicus]|uniref:leukocyte receptor cluster member 9 n=1 Tax=Scomber japonicus TaxID=13676 RepID=UPI0023069946|nr:leukocyte receptor cluster member 9 [Scomber japonicus]
MASDASGVPPTSSEDQRVDGTQLAPTRPEAGVPGGPSCGKQSSKATAESAEGDEDGVNVCPFFLMGKCHFGQRCRLSHSDPLIDDSGAVPSDQDDKQEGEKMEKNKKKKGKVNKATKPQDDEGKDVSKKPRMRTADDVISRILWDPSVDASKFVVGYVDRFLGVLERPFSDFNWDVNPCDCDYTTELALPRHRIQYFTYRGHRVWDRHSRTDRVFGSTGQSLAPPFGGEEEVEEDQQQQERLILEQDILEVTEDQPPAASGQEERETEECSQTEYTHLEEEKQNEMNICPPDSAQAAPKCRHNTSQEQEDSQGACVAEEASNRLNESTGQMSSSQKEGASVEMEGKEDALEEWEESWEGNENVSSYLAAKNISVNPSTPLEQREEKRAGRPPKKRPTHFITFRANTPAILTGSQQLQEELICLLPSSAPHWLPASSLHVTMCLLNLSGPAEVAAAGEMLRRFAHLDRNPPVAVTFPVKLKHFNGKVLYLSPQPQLPLQQLNSGLQEAYRKEGWLHKDSYNPRYHLTLAKVKDREGERIFEGVGDLKVGKGLNFGRLPVNTLHLCAMGGPKVDGFYETPSAQ